MYPVKKFYDAVLVTNGAAFYKKRLYSQIAKHVTFLAVYTVGFDKIRNEDFYKGESNFDNVSFSSTSCWGKIRETLCLLKKISYGQLIVCGWASIPNWFFAFLSPKKKNAVFIDSSYWESQTTGIKGWIKRLFLCRFSLAYCSGKAHAELMKRLDFRGKIVDVHGVGLYRRIPQPPYEERREVKNFIYVGRLVSEKNLKFLISEFNKHPELVLNIVGEGPLENELKSLANDNIRFHGAIPNEELPNFYQKNDVFVLPSVSETWGLVVEEALNNGLPILLSNHVGCAEDLVNPNETGYVFDLGSKKDFEDKLGLLCNLENHNRLRRRISERDPKAIEDAQIETYVENIIRKKAPCQK